MIKSNLMLAKLLTYSGALPFLGAIFLAIFEQQPLATQLITSYASIIITFISGIHWGIYLNNQSTKLNLFIISNIITLIAWFILFLGSTKVILLGQVSCFLMLLLIDKQLINSKIITSWFYQTRLLTTVIVISLIIGFYLTIQL